MTKILRTITFFSFITFFLTPAYVSATQPSYDSGFAIASYCNTQALQRLNAYMDERYAGEYITVSDQYNILDENFSACLSHEGYQISRDSDGNMGYNYLHQY